MVGNYKKIVPVDLQGQPSLRDLEIYGAKEGYKEPPKPLSSQDAKSLTQMADKLGEEKTQHMKVVEPADVSALIAQFGLPLRDEVVDALYRRFSLEPPPHETEIPRIDSEGSI